MHPMRATDERRIPLSFAQARRRAAGVTAVSLGLALTLLGADAARANTLTGPTSPRTRGRRCR